MCIYFPVCNPVLAIHSIHQFRCTAIISFLAAFFLVRYSLQEAKKEQLEVEGSAHVQSPTQMPDDPEKATNERTSTPDAMSVNPAKMKKISEPPIFSSDPHIVQRGPFGLKPPTHLLRRCHSLCITLASIGFILALIGVITCAWARHPTSVSAFSTVCLGFCIIAGVSILMT